MDLAFAATLLFKRTEFNHYQILSNQMIKVFSLHFYNHVAILFAGPNAIPVQYIEPLSRTNSEYLLNAWSTFHNIPKKLGITVHIHKKSFVFPRDLVFRYHRNPIGSHIKDTCQLFYLHLPM